MSTEPGALQPDDLELGSPTYVQVTTRRASAMVLAEFAPAVRDILDRGTLYGYAAQHLGRRMFTGRGPAYAVPLGSARAVVRHGRHGGMFARLTGDVFLAPTRAPHELSVSLQLRSAGVRTPEVLAYATYPAGPLLRRVDVVTREVPSATDMATYLAEHPSEPAWAAATELVQALGRAGAYHADLNVRNVLLARTTEGGLEAFALDVDRVVWRRVGDPAVARANIRRLYRSARKEGLR